MPRPICKFKCEMISEMEPSFEVCFILFFHRKIGQLKSLAFLDIFGVLSETALKVLQDNFPEIGINKFHHSAIARPTVGSRRTSIWGLRTRD